MRLEFAFLADAAIASGDGRFSVLGGDRVAVEAREFPAVLPSIALVVKLGFSSGEHGRSFSIRIQVDDEAGNVVAPEATGVVEAPKPKQPNFPSVAGVVANFVGLSLKQPGRYVFRTFVGDEEFAPTYFYVTQVETSAPSTGIE